MDHHTRIDHAMPDGRSDELYKGLTADSATAVFNGKIMVHPDAQRIEAYQSNANLILANRRPSTPSLSSRSTRTTCAAATAVRRPIRRRSLVLPPPRA